MDISPPETGRRQTVKTKIADAVLSVQPISIENKSTSTDEASAEETVRLGEIVSVSTPQIVQQPATAVNRRRLCKRRQTRLPSCVTMVKSYLPSRRCRRKSCGHRLHDNRSTPTLPTLPSEDGTPSISHAVKTAPAISL